MRLVLLLMVLLLQDPADKVRALVEKLGSDEIAERQKAAKELLKLGPPALPALRGHVEKADGERKVVLQSIVAKLEREVRLQKLLESPPVVTLKVRDAVIEDVLEDIAKQTGLQVEGFMLDASFRVTAEFDRVPLWKALDEIGRLHGGVITHYYPARVLVEPGARTGSPLVIHKGLGLHLRPVVRTATGAVELQAVINHAPGLPIWSTSVEYKELTDDLGKSLVDKEPGLEEWFAPSFAGPASPKNFACCMSHRSKAAASDGAVRLKRVRGSAVVGLALDLKSLLVIPVSAKEEEASGSANGYGATVKVTRQKDTVTVMVSRLTHPDANDEEDPDLAEIPKWTFALRDKDGKLHMGRVKDLSWGDSDKVKVEIALPAGKEIASIELVEPEQLTEIAIPFDFTDLPIPPLPKPAPPAEDPQSDE